MRFESGYGKIERILHRIAFCSLEAQKSLSDIESRIYAKRLSGIAIDRPVFITSLPRAGTTLLLDAFAGSGAFVAHSYRNMPFLFTPLLWDAASRPFRKPGVVVERVHADGMTVSVDSPESFEEALWHAFWPGKHAEGRIELWGADGLAPNGEFASFFREHMRKIIALSSPHFPEFPRYVSKNNANIARLPQIARLFPDAVILVPFRNPLDHAFSMLRQHRRFEDIHAREPFTRRYMRDTGHFDFGANLRPIAFPGAPRPDAEAARTLRFWLQYWRAAFEHLLHAAPSNAAFVSYDALCADPDPGLRGVATRAGVGEELFASFAPRFRAPNHYDPSGFDLPPGLLESASGVHDELLARSI